MSDFLYMPAFPSDAYDRWLCDEPAEPLEERDEPEPDLEDEGMPMFDEED